MAAAGAQAAADLAAAVELRDTTRLPAWYGNPAKDAFAAEDWWDRFEYARNAAGWPWDRTIGNFFQALKDYALEWFKATKKHYEIQNIDELKRVFLAAYARGATSRTSIAHIKVVQPADKPVVWLWGKMQKAIDELELAVRPAVVPLAANEILRGFVAPAAAAHVAALDLATLQANWRRIELEGYMRFYQPVFRALFIDGLIPRIREEVVRKNPDTLTGAYEAALKVEAEIAQDKKVKTANVLEVKEEKEEEAVEAIGSWRGRGHGRPSRGRGQRGSYQNTGTRDAMCYYCEKKGHFQRDCFKRQRENGAMKGKPKGRGSVQEMEEFTPPPPQPRPEPEYVYIDQIEHLNW
jgi:hypothetical protein